MATVLKCDLFTVSSLRVLKDGNNPSICLINARSNRSYIGVYEGDKIILEDQIMANDEVIEYINEHKKYTVCGNVNYLSLKGHESNICKEMMSLKKSLTATPNPMAVSPIYMRD